MRGHIRGWAAVARARVGSAASAQGFYAKHLRYGDLVFDIGAHHGRHTQAMVHRGASVVALEPQETLARDLAGLFPQVTVLSSAVGDRPGTAVLHTSTGNSALSTLNEAWASDIDETGAAWDSRETVQITTLDELIARFGQPELVKIDTEGYEDRVLAGLSHPVRQVLFEVHASLRDVAAASFEQLARLGRYEYRVMERESWILGARTTADAVMSSLPSWGDVYARKVA